MMNGNSGKLRESFLDGGTVIGVTISGRQQFSDLISVNLFEAMRLPF